MIKNTSIVLFFAICLIIDVRNFCKVNFSAYLILILDFIFSVKMGDCSGCSEIIKNCNNLDVSLTETQNNKYFYKFHKHKVKNIEKPSFTMKF